MSEGGLFDESGPSSPAVPETGQSTKALPIHESADRPAPPEDFRVAPEETIQETSRPISTGRALRGAIGLGLVFGLASALLELRILAIALLPHILRPGENIDFLEATDGLPLPRLLNWNLSLLDFFQTLQNLGGPWLLLLGGALFGLLLLCAISVLNPTFRPLHFAETAESRAARAIEIEAGQTVRAVTLLIAAFLPVAVLTIGLRGVSSESARLAGYAVSGALLWALFRRDGLAGDFARAGWNPQRSTLPRLAMSGALFGLGAWAARRWLVPDTLTDILNLYPALGTFHSGYATEIARCFLLCASAAGFVVGALLFALGRPVLSFSQRLLILVPALAACGIAVWFAAAFSPARLAARLDLTANVRRSRYPWNPRYPVASVPDGPRVAQELAKRTELPPPLLDAPAPERSFLVFGRRGVFTARQSLLSEDGLRADPDSSPRVMEFLKTRRFRTALSWVAIKHIFNVATVHFDTTAACAVLLLDQQQCPHLAQCQPTLRAMLFTCAASPQNLALLNTWADETQFGYPDRESLRLMGDLYVRFGEVDRALVWYRKAEMPRSFLARVQGEKPLFHAGRVTGTLRLNGKPLSGAQVGVIPKRLNGLPRDLEGVVLTSEREVRGAPYFARPGFPPGHVRPWAFRWISAGTTTDANGVFQMENLTEGEYYLVVTLPGGLNLNPPFDPSLKVSHAPKGITLNYRQPTLDLGTIAMTHR